MNARPLAFASAFLALTALLAPGRSAARPLAFVDLPRGATVTGTVPLSAPEVAAVSERIGVTLTSLRNDIVSIRGFEVQVNTMEVSSEDEARDLVKKVDEARHGPGFVGRSGHTVVEIAQTGRLDVAARLLAALGMLDDRPVHYEARFLSACVDGVDDYMQCNPVFNLFLHPLGEKSEEEIRSLTKGWKLGRSIALFTGSRAYRTAKYELDQEPARKEEKGEVTRFELAAPPKRAGLPYASVTARIDVRHCYHPVPAPPPGTALTKATRRWPVEDAKVRSLALGLTGWQSTDLDRAEAILDYVRGSISFGGKGTGTRCGVSKVLEQRVGQCWDKSDAFVTLCRAARIPARQIAGWMPSLKGEGGHVWAEVYIRDQGWIPVDPTNMPWLGTTTEYVPWFASDDGEMPLVYLAMPEITRTN